MKTDGTLSKQPSGRWAISVQGRDPVEITSGDVFVLEVAGELQQTRMEYRHLGGARVSITQSMAMRCVTAYVRASSIFASGMESCGLSDDERPGYRFVGASDWCNPMCRSRSFFHLVEGPAMSGRYITLLVLATAAIFAFMEVVTYMFDLSREQGWWLDAAVCATIVLGLVWRSQR